MTSGVSFVAAVRRFMGDYLASLSARGPLGELLVRARRDPAFRRRFVGSPDEVLAEAHIALPPGIRVEVVENSAQVIHIVLPPLAGESE
jgi:hypothetical protein